MWTLQFNTETTLSNGLRTTCGREVQEEPQKNNDTYSLLWGWPRRRRCRPNSRPPDQENEVPQRTSQSHFWKRWQLEYLLDLGESHCQQCAGSSDDDATAINTGDALLQEDKLHAFWRLDRVRQLIIGHDGRVRVAILAVPSGDGQTSAFQKPIQLLYPLEPDLKTSSGTQAPETRATIVQPTQSTQDFPKETRVRPREQ